MDIAAHASTQTEVFEVQKSLKTVMFGSLAEGSAGGSAIALAIIGLAGIVPSMMVAISTIAIGGALLCEGGAIATRFSSLLLATSKGQWDTSELGGGMTAEFLGGVAGAILGILGLLNMVPMVLIPVAAIVYGSALILGSGATVRLNSLLISHSEEHKIAKEVAREAVIAAAGIQVLIGLGSIVLGILALTGISPLYLSLVAMLAVGFADFLSGTAVGGRMLSAFSH